MRRFLGLLFCGAGERSVQHVGLLHERLNEAVSWLGGDQQGGTRHERIESQAEIEDIVRDLAAALLGREVTFGETLPYPPPQGNDWDLQQYWDTVRGKVTERFPAPLPAGCTCPPYALTQVLRCDIHRVRAVFPADHTLRPLGPSPVKERQLFVGNRIRNTGGDIQVVTGIEAGCVFTEGNVYPMVESGQWRKHWMHEDGTPIADTRGARLSAMHCGHANEMPTGASGAFCRCPENCYCRDHSCRPPV